MKKNILLFFLLNTWLLISGISILSAQVTSGSIINSNSDSLQTILITGEPEEAGLNASALLKIDEIVNKAVHDSVFPGAVVAVAKDGILAYNKAFGYQDYTKKVAVKAGDVYDLASITKVAATTLSVMKLLDEGKISLEDAVSKYIPEFNSGKKSQIRIRDFLLHQSGLPPFRVYVDSLTTREEIVEAIKNEPLIYEPATKYVYSDLGMILMAEIIHKVSGLPINEYAKREFYSPLEMNSTLFNPADSSEEFIQRIAPTEIDTTYGRGIVHAHVHDERAYFMDGVAGHAGLFSSAGDLAKLSLMLLNEGTYGDQKFLNPQTVHLFTGIQSEFSGRGYGFDRKAREGFSTAGSLASNDTFGHLGFTGTSFWIDRDKDMAVILLTNRTFPHRSYGKKISRIRSSVADAAYSAIRSTK